MQRHSKRAAPIIQGLPKENYKENFEKDGYMLVSIDKSKRQNISERNLMVTLRSFINNILTRVGVISDAKYMAWEGLYEPKTYQPNAVVRDAEWTMIANKETNDRPAPQPDGEAEDILPVDPTWANLNDTSTISLEHIYTFSQGGWYQGLRLWVDEVSPNTEHHLYVQNTTPAGNFKITTVSLPENLVAGQWNIVDVQKVIVAEGTVTKFIYSTLNSGADTQVTGGWRKLRIDNNGVPATGEWLLNNGRDRLRIHKTDLDSTDRTSELLGTIPNSEWDIVQTDNTSKSQFFIQTSAPVDAGTYIEVDVIEQSVGSNGRIDDNAISTNTITIPVPLSTKYVEEANYWDTPANIPSFLSTVTSSKEFDGVPQAGGNNVYGIDFNFQPGLISPDWELVSIS